MNERVLAIGWTTTGHKPHLPNPYRKGLSVCGWPISPPERRKVSLTDSDPVGGLCARCKRWGGLV